MDPLTLTITTAGLLRFTAAQGGEDIDLTVASVGITDSVFVVAPTLTALPGEFKRLQAVSGTVVAADLVHVTVRDDSQDGYGIRGIGLFLADGTLFAVYGSPTRIVEKSAQSVTLLALDIAFPANIVAAIRFGDTNFLYPPASETVKGVARFATQDEANAGDVQDRVVTPWGLRKLVARIIDLIDVLRSRKVWGGGLATGGGDLGADRTITVVKASPAEVDAGQLDDRAVTPLALVNILGRIGALTGRNILTSGLATGGGSLAADRMIAVPRASGAEVDALVIDDKAVTPWSLKPLVARIIGLVDDLRSRKVWGGGLATGGGDLGADRTITVAKASSADADAGLLDDRAVTPHALVNILGRIGALTGRNILTSGLATGGGSLAADRMIDVPRATTADVRAGVADDRAVTPYALATGGYARIAAAALIENGGYRLFDDGYKECWGVVFVPATTAVTIALPVAHSSWVVPIAGGVRAAADEQSFGVAAIVGAPPTGFTIRNNNTEAVTVRWHSKGV